MKKILFIFLLTTSFKFGTAQAWLPMGEGTFGNVYSLAADSLHNRLFVTGSFTNMDTLVANGGAIWNGTQWQHFIHDGNQNGFSSLVYKTMIWGNYLYYDKIAGSGVQIYRMDLNTLNSEYLGFVNSGILDMAVFRDTLYICGNFTGMISKYDGVNWISITDNGSLGSGWGFGLLDMEVYNDKLYVAGDFEITTPWIMKGAAAWNGTTWEDIDSNLTANMGDFGVFYYSIKAYHDKIYLGGKFGLVNGSPGEGLLVLNGNQWQSTMTDFWGVGTMEVFKDKLFIGGALGTTSGMLSNYSCIINNDTNTYYALYDSLCPKGGISCFEQMNGNLYVGGDFSIIKNFNSPTYARAVAYLDPDTIIISGTKENLIAEKEELKIYPNPANETLTIALNTNCNNCTTQVYNLLGEKIISQPIEKNKSEINITALTSGVYFLKISNEHWCEVQKFVKE